MWRPKRELRESDKRHARQKLLLLALLPLPRLKVVRLLLLLLKTQRLRETPTQHRVARDQHLARVPATYRVPLLQAMAIPRGLRTLHRSLLLPYELDWSRYFFQHTPVDQSHELGAHLQLLRGNLKCLERG